MLTFITHSYYQVTRCQCHLLTITVCHLGPLLRFTYNRCTTWTRMKECRYRNAWEYQRTGAASETLSPGSQVFPVPVVQLVDRVHHVRWRHAPHCPSPWDHSQHIPTWHHTHPTLTWLATWALATRRHVGPHCQDLATCHTCHLTTVPHTWHLVTTHCLMHHVTCTVTMKLVIYITKQTLRLTIVMLEQILNIIVKSGKTLSDNWQCHSYYYVLFSSKTEGIYYILKYSHWTFVPFTYKPYYVLGNNSFWHIREVLPFWINLIWIEDRNILLNIYNWKMLW